MNNLEDLDEYGRDSKGVYKMPILDADIETYVNLLPIYMKMPLMGIQRLNGI